MTIESREQERLCTGFCKPHQPRSLQKVRWPSYNIASSSVEWTVRYQTELLASSASILITVLSQTGKRNPWLRCGLEQPLSFPSHSGAGKSDYTLRSVLCCSQRSVHFVLLAVCSASSRALFAVRCVASSASGPSVGSYVSLACARSRFC